MQIVTCILIFSLVGCTGVIMLSVKTLDKREFELNVLCANSPDKYERLFLQLKVDYNFYQLEC